MTDHNCLESELIGNGLHRSVQFEWTATNTTLPAVTTSLGKELRNDFVITAGYPELACYINYAHGDESLEQKYGAEKLPRLTALKKIWDPNGLFDFNNALPTGY